MFDLVEFDEIISRELLSNPGSGRATILRRRSQSGAPTFLSAGCGCAPDTPARMPTLRPRVGQASLAQVVSPCWNEILGAFSLQADSQRGCCHKYCGVGRIKGAGKDRHRWRIHKDRRIGGIEGAGKDGHRRRCHEDCRVGGIKGAGKDSKAASINNIYILAEY